MGPVTGGFGCIAKGCDRIRGKMLSRGAKEAAGHQTRTVLDHLRVDVARRQSLHLHARAVALVGQRLTETVDVSLGEKISSGLKNILS
jgi:hypothetical protein